DLLSTLRNGLWPFPRRLAPVLLHSTIEPKDGESGTAESRASLSPILPEMDQQTMAAFPTGKPREAQLETVICKHCKRPVLRQMAAEHIQGCLRAKQERARKKKEARDAANRAKRSEEHTSELQS